MRCDYGCAVAAVLALYLLMAVVLASQAAEAHGPLAGLVVLLAAIVLVLLPLPSLYGMKEGIRR